MKKHFLIVVSVSVTSLFLATPGKAVNGELTHTEIVSLVNHINNELTIKDIPALEDKIVVLDIEGNILLEEPQSDFEEKTNSSEERRLVSKSAFLMEYAGDSYYILER